jgi:hypothetical protein
MADAKSPLCFDPALGHLYTDPHRAFFRLLVDDLIARHHLRHTYEEETWPSHIACGKLSRASHSYPLESADCLAGPTDT